MAGLRFFAALVALALGAGSAGAQERAATPAALGDAIKRLHPEARVVSAEEILEERCGAKQRREQLFRADFTGNGRQDYAALLRIGEPAGKPLEVLRTAPLWGVVFLANRDGRYRPFILFKDEDAMVPSRRVLWVQPPGPIRHGTRPGRILTLTNPGVGSMLCESTAKVFYWVGVRQTFREYLIKE